MKMQSMSYLYSVDVSIIIPAFNSRGFIQRSVQSALEQTGVAIEVIVVDDGSTDGTGEFVQEVFPTVRTIRQSNSGQAIARNIGVDAARGEYIAFLDADDWWDISKLIKQVDLMRCVTDLSFCFTDFKGVDEEGQVYGWQGGLRDQLLERGIALTKQKENMYSLEGDVLNTLIRHTSFMHPSTMLIKKDFFRKVGGFDGSRSPAEDLELWMRMAWSGRCGFIDEVLVTTEARPGSEGRRFERMTEQLIRLYEDVPSRYPDIPTELKKHASRYVTEKRLSLAWYLGRRGAHRLAREHLIKAMSKRITMKLLFAYIKSVALQLTGMR